MRASCCADFSSANRALSTELRIQSIADFSGLGGFLHLPVRTYSSGMMMRLMFAIATSAEFDIVLMDEWLATGDQAFLTKADFRLREIARAVQSARARLASGRPSAAGVQSRSGARGRPHRIRWGADEALAVHGAMQAA